MPSPSPKSYQTFPGQSDRDGGSTSSTSTSTSTRSSSHSPGPGPNSSAPPSPSRPGRDTDTDTDDNVSPLPLGQLLTLAVMCLAEQTAMNSISPYLPQMALSFPEVDSSTVGLYVGLIASVFAFAQCVSGYFWGFMSDWIGRKPVIMIGTTLTMTCFLAFGFCHSLSGAIAIQATMGLVNGNVGVVSTCLGELTDKSNQGKVFAYLPVVYGIGTVIGPAMSGCLVREHPDRGDGLLSRFPFLLPNLVAALVLLADLVICVFFFKESLTDPAPLSALTKTLKGYLSVSSSEVNLRSDNDGQDEHDRGNQTTDNREPRLDGPDHTTGDDGDSAELKPISEAFSRQTILILISYLLFSFSNVAYLSIFPVFAATPPPTGRDLSPHEIGLLLSFSGVVAIAFQVLAYGPIRRRIGNRSSYRTSQAVMALAFLVTPWVGYRASSRPSVVSVLPSPSVLWLEFGSALILRTISSVCGLTSALLLVSQTHEAGISNCRCQKKKAASVHISIPNRLLTA